MYLASLFVVCVLKFQRLFINCFRVHPFSSRLKIRDFEFRVKAAANDAGRKQNRTFTKCVMFYEVSNCIWLKSSDIQLLRKVFFTVACRASGPLNSCFCNELAQCTLSFDARLSFEFLAWWHDFVFGWLSSSNPFLTCLWLWGLGKWLSPQRNIFGYEREKSATLL